MAALVTLGLFGFMAGMIGQDVRLDEEKSTPQYDFLAKIEPTKPTPTTKPTTEQLKPPPPVIIETPSPGGRPNPVNPGTLPGQGTGSKGKIELSGPGGPSLRVAPTFPQACASKNVQGVVIVEFDVTAEGAVTNIRILSTPDRCFERAVRRAVAKWKYPPRTVNGRAVPRRGVQEAINFKLDG